MWLELKFIRSKVAPAPHFMGPLILSLGVWSKAPTVNGRLQHNINLRRYCELPHCCQAIATESLHSYLGWMRMRPREYMGFESSANAIIPTN